MPSPPTHCPKVHDLNLHLNKVLNELASCSWDSRAKCLWFFCLNMWCLYQPCLATLGLSSPTMCCVAGASVMLNSQNALPSGLRLGSTNGRLQPPGMRKSLGACSWGCLPSSSHTQQGPGCPRHHQQQSQLPLPSAGWAPADSILLSAQALRRVPQIQQESRLLSANDVPKILMPLPPLTLPIPKMAVTSLVSSALCQHPLPALGLPISSINQSLDSLPYETAKMTALLT